MTLNYCFYGFICLFIATHCQAEKRFINVVSDARIIETDYYYNLLYSIYDDNNYDIKIIYMPFSRAMLQVSNGSADLVLGVYSGFSPSNWYSRYPVEIDRVDAAVSHEVNETWRDSSSLDDKKLAASYGY